MDYNDLESQFEEDSNKIFRNNVENYTPNDYDFLKQLNQMFGNAMSAKGLNTLDPLYANFFHYNKMSMRGNADFPRVTRTYVFFTRPELNFSFENINSVPFFKWLYSKRIGKMIFAALTDPDYFIYAPSAMNNTSIDFTTLNEALSAWIKTQKALEKQVANGVNDDNWKAEMSSLSDGDTPGKSMFSDDNIVKNGADSGIEASAKAAIDKENSSDAGMDDTQNSNLPTDAEIGGLIDDVSMESLLERQNQMASIFNTLYGGESKNGANGFNSGMTSKAAILGMTPAELNKNNLTLAKYALRDTHNSPNDRFTYTTPFIPLLQNTCTQLTGAKDFELQEHQYEEDEFSGKMTVPTGMDEIFGPGSFTTNHEDILYGPVSLLYMVWVLYIHYVSRGYIMPTREHITERILDYTCSAYVMVIGDDGRRIERFGKYTGCYPTTFPLSQQLDHNLQVEPDMLQKLSISWKYNRYEPMDPQIFTDFNFLSESEWLVKLNPALWEDLYNRYSSVTANMFIKLYGGSGKNPKSEVQKIMLRNLKRPEGLWEMIDDKDRGMSGKLPPALIEPLNDFSEINMINNFWGGYPYIVNGTELCWVLPQYGKLQGVNRDKFNKSGKQVLDDNNSNNIEDMTKTKSGYDDLAGSISSAAEVVKADSIAGNASSSYLDKGMSSTKNLGVLNNNKSFGMI